MISLEALQREYRELDNEELARWIASALVHAEGTPGAWRFKEIDVARIGLILTLRREMEVEEQSLPVVLALLDQVYDMRRSMSRLNEAFAAIPAEIRDAVLNRLG
jgi:chaperone modulatory protein CbpM